MREVHATVSATLSSAPKLKQYALYFDKLHVIQLYSDYPGNPPFSPEIYEAFVADLMFLYERGVVAEPARDTDYEKYMEHLAGLSSEITLPWFDPRSGLLNGFVKGKKYSAIRDVDHRRDLMARSLAMKINDDGDVDAVAVCEHQLPVRLDSGANLQGSIEFLAKVAVESVPLPDERCSWEEIIDFRVEMKEKRFEFRRFLQSLVMKARCDSDVRDELDWALDTYVGAMRRRKWALVNSSITALLIPTIDFLHNPESNHILSLATGAAVAISKIKLELLDGEVKAPGRECAYVFEARKRFNQAHSDITA